MIVGIGVDVCSIERFQTMVQRRPGIAARILTPAELGERIESQAARFAAKEALAKALGSPGGLSWMDAEVRKDEHGKPSFGISGTVAARASELSIRRIHLSLSHDAGVATAFVVCES
ncbi:MAG TPA: holo-ACP synthase [Propionibacteriaceae bacterium]|nr:holo-ACP synthase [Propionibacteriaceae bacterium]